MTDKIISIYWFFILFIVTSAIVFIVYSLYGQPLDVRETEALFLAEQLGNYVALGGKINQGIFYDNGVLALTNENLLKKCNLNFEVEDFKGWKNDQFFVSLLFLKEEANVGFVASGNENLRKDANVNYIILKRKKFPFCEERLIYAKEEEGRVDSIKITACVRKTEKNA